MTRTPGSLDSYKIRRPTATEAHHYLRQGVMVGYIGDPPPCSSEPVLLFNEQVRVLAEISR